MSAPQLNQICTAPMPCLANDSTCSTLEAELTAFSMGYDHALFDVERRRALIDDPYESDRHLDVGEQIDRQPLQRRHPQHDHGKGQHQDADAVAEGE